MSTVHEVNKSNLLNIHQQNLQNNHSNIYNTTKLIAILGGIDEILTNYLTSKNEMILNQSQLQSINEIILSQHPNDHKLQYMYTDDGNDENEVSESPNSNTVHSFIHEDKAKVIVLKPASKDIISIAVDDIDRDKSPSPHSQLKQTNPSSINTKTTAIIINPTPYESSKQLWYTFSRNDTYLNHMFTDKTSAKIVNYVHSSIPIIYTTVGGLIWAIWHYLEEQQKGHWSISFYIYKLIYFFFGTIYLTLFILSVNKDAMRGSAKHFVFWFKLFNSLQTSICRITLMYILIKNRNVGVTQLMGDVFALLSEFLLVTGFSAIDGFQISKKAKIAIGIASSLVFSMAAFNYTFLIDYNLYQQAIVKFHIIQDIQFSVLSIYASSLRVLSIFLWKQTILSMIKTDQCINIRHSPYIEWDNKQRSKIT